MTDRVLMGNEQEPTPAELALPRARPVVGRSGVARIWSLPLPVLVSLIVATCLAKYGVGRFVSWKYMYALAVHWRDPFSSSLFKPSTSYLLSSPTSALVSGLTGLSTRREFFALHFGLSLAAIALPVAMPSVRRDRYLRAIIGLVVVGGALPAVLLSWVGSYDPVSLGAATVGALADSPTIGAIGWALFGFNNSPEAILAFGAYALVSLYSEGPAALRSLAGCAAGLCVGIVGISALTSHWGGSTSRITMFRYWPFSAFWRSELNYWPLILYSALGIGWLIFLKREARVRKAARALCAVAVVASAAVPLVVLDQSRIVSGTLWAAALFAARDIAGSLSEEQLDGLLRRVTLPAFVFPVMLVWSGQIVYAGWQHGIEFIQSVV